MSATCVFCKIERGELEASMVHSSDGFIAFLDKRPLFPGHVLVTPREHRETLADLDEATIGPLFTLVRRVSIAVEAALECDGIFNAINNKISQSVPHLHVHVIPRRKGDGLKGFFWPRHAYKDESDQERIRAAIAAKLA